MGCPWRSDMAYLIWVVLSTGRRLLADCDLVDLEPPRTVQRRGKREDKIPFIHVQRQYRIE